MAAATRERLMFDDCVRQIRRTRRSRRWRSCVSSPPLWIVLARQPLRKLSAAGRGADRSTDSLVGAGR